MPSLLRDHAQERNQHPADNVPDTYPYSDCGVIPLGDLWEVVECPSAAMLNIAVAICNPKKAIADLRKNIETNLPFKACLLLFYPNSYSLIYLFCNRIRCSLRRSVGRSYRNISPTPTKRKYRVNTSKNSSNARR